MAETTPESSSPAGDDARARDTTPVDPAWSAGTASSDRPADTTAFPAAPAAPAVPVTPTYTATPYAGAPVAYEAAAPVVVAERPRRRPGLVVGGVIAASLLVVGLSFGGGVALGVHLGGNGPGFSTMQGFPGGDGTGSGTRPEPPNGGFGGQQGGSGQNGTGSGTGQSGSGTGTGS